MKNRLLFIALVFTSYSTLAQNVSLKKDTILSGKKAYAIFKKNNSTPSRYFIYSLAGKELMEIHYGHINEKEKPLYIITFSNDHKQAMIGKQPGFPKSLILEIVKYNLIDNGLAINDRSELQFIKAHSLPDGYTDLDQLIEY